MKIILFIWFVASLALVLYYGIIKEANLQIAWSTIGICSLVLLVGVELKERHEK